MRNFKTGIVIIIINTLTVSCGLWLAPPLKVLSVYFDSGVCVQFSARPSKQAIRKAFSLTEDGSAVSGDLSFYDNKVLFVPANGLRKGREYIVFISTVAEDEKGNSLQEDFFYTFWTKDKLEAPGITGIFPENEQLIDRFFEKLIISFSAEIDIISFNEAFKISPVCDFVPAWTEGNSKVELLLTKPLKKGTRYFINISNLLMDKNRNNLTEPFKSSFLYGNDAEAPKMSVKWDSKSTGTGNIYENTINYGIPSDSEIIIEFDEEVSVESLAQFIEIHPNLVYSIQIDYKKRNKANLVFQNYPERDKQYNLKIKKGISDNYENKTNNDSEYPLLFNLEKFKPVIFESAFLVEENNEYTILNKDTDYSYICLDPILYPPSSYPKSAKLYIIFSISSEAQSISIISAMEAIHLFSTNSCVNISLKSIKTITDEEYGNTVIYGLVDSVDKKLAILELDLDIENSNKQGFVIFKIDKSISDNLGNKLKENCILTYNKI